MLNTKQIGNVTEVECILAFLKLGYNILLPYGDCERYDLVADVNGKFYKIQCKTAISYDNGDSFKISCRSSHRANGKCINERYTSKDVDFFGTSWNGKYYLIPQSECRSHKTLRMNLPSNGQTKGVSFAKDYEIETILQKL